MFGLKITGKLMHNWYILVYDTVPGCTGHPDAASSAPSASRRAGRARRRTARCPPRGTSARCTRSRRGRSWRCTAGHGRTCTGSAPWAAGTPLCTARTSPPASRTPSSSAQLAQRGRLPTGWRERGCSQRTTACTYGTGTKRQTNRGDNNLIPLLLGETVKIRCHWWLLLLIGKRICLFFPISIKKNYSTLKWFRSF